MQPTLADTAPEGGGWLMCDGGEVAKAEYPTLYAAIGATYGETADTFTLPDLRGRMVMGTGENGAPELTAFGGAQFVTLTEAELPSHAHAITDEGHTHTFTGDPHAHAVTDPGHSHTVTDPGHAHSAASPAGAADSAAGGDTTSAEAGSTGSSSAGITIDSATTGISIQETTATGSNAAATTGITVQDTGGGGSFDIIPPVVGVNWLIRT